MTVTINGRLEAIPTESCTLEDLVAARGLAPQRVAIEHNRGIVPRERWPHVFLKENDRVEIVSFVGGG